MLGYLLDSNAAALFSSPSTTANNNGHRIISSFIRPLSCVILKFSILAGCKAADVYELRNLCLFIPLHTFYDQFVHWCNIGAGVQRGRYKTNHLFLLFLCLFYCVYSQHSRILCVSKTICSHARLWHREIYHASLFVLRGWAPTNQSPPPLLLNLDAIATLPMGAFNWSGDIKERLWRHSRRVKGHKLWSADKYADHVGWWVGSMTLQLISISHVLITDLFWLLLLYLFREVPLRYIVTYCRETGLSGENPYRQRRREAGHGNMRDTSNKEQTKHQTQEIHRL